MGSDLLFSIYVLFFFPFSLSMPAAKLYEWQCCWSVSWSVHPRHMRGTDWAASTDHVLTNPQLDFDLNNEMVILLNISTLALR